MTAPGKIFVLYQSHSHQAAPPWSCRRPEASALRLTTVQASVNQDVMSKAKVAVRLIVGSEADARALSVKEPGTVVLAIEQRALAAHGRGKGKPTRYYDGVARWAARDGRTARLGPQEWAVVTRLLVHGAASSREMHEALCFGREDGGPGDAAVHTWQVLRRLEPHLAKLGLRVESGVDLYDRRRLRHTLVEIGLDKAISSYSMELTGGQNGYPT